MDDRLGLRALLRLARRHPDFSSENLSQLLQVRSLDSVVV